MRPSLKVAAALYRIDETRAKQESNGKHLSPALLKKLIVENSCSARNATLWRHLANKHTVPQRHAIQALHAQYALHARCSG